mmetsp:Transcript_16573/g.36737  ORF Transcript_16573/g.36737 Transcript_16573/m.36737 type:complete len:429 (-) Transcript_16573:207-1493(-)
MQPGRELEAVVDLREAEGRQVEVEALQVHGEHWRESLECDALLRVLLAVPLCLVLVLALQHLDGCVLAERVVDVTAALHVQLDVVEVLCALALVLHVHAADVAAHRAREELLGGVLHDGALHLLLQLVDQHAHHLLHVLLQKGLRGGPAEGHRELLGADLLGGKLQILEDVLQREGGGGGKCLAVEGQAVHRAAELVHVEEHLQQRIEVAGGAEVLQPHHACGLEAVVAPGRDGGLKDLLHRHTDAHRKKTSLLGIEGGALQQQGANLCPVEEMPLALVVALVPGGPYEGVRGRRVAFEQHSPVLGSQCETKGHRQLPFEGQVARLVVANERGELALRRFDDQQQAPLHAVPEVRRAPNPPLPVVRRLRQIEHVCPTLPVVHLLLLCIPRAILLRDGLGDSVTLHDHLSAGLVVAPQVIVALCTVGPR